MLNKAIVIGGSAGSYKIVLKILSFLPKNPGIPIFICLHRLRSARKGFAETLHARSSYQVIEPEDKEKIELNKIYVAPANYHMYIENKNTIALSIEDEINHSRPSIDITFQSAAEAYRNNLMGIILSGANHDGAFGLLKIKEHGGLTIVQNPEECEISVMPLACVENNSADKVQSVTEIIHSIQNFISIND